MTPKAKTVKAVGIYINEDEDGFGDGIVHVETYGGRGAFGMWTNRKSAQIAVKQHANKWYKPHIVDCTITFKIPKEKP